VSSVIDNRIRSIAVGSFDGMHVAHRELISLADAVAVIERGRGPRLTPGYKRSFYCDKPLSFYLFERIRHLSAPEFVAKLLEDFPSLEKIVVGYDFRFGKDRQGSARTLEKYFGGEVVVISEVAIEGLPVHARTIRELLAEGNLERANRLLGRAYRIDGEPIQGQGIGSKELVPTINLGVEDYQLPREGVYATRTRIGDRWYPSVTFLGDRSSTGGGFAVETHLLETDPGEVKERIFVEFHEFLRQNRRFDSLKALKKQIASDIEEARGRLNPTS